MKRYKIFFQILPKQDVLDVEGRAVQRKLEQEKFPVKHCRIGKCIDMEVEAPNLEEVKRKAKEMADKILFNPLVEDYKFEILS